MSFFWSSIKTPSTFILLNKLKSTCFTAKFVFNSLDRILAAFDTSQFCTQLICIIPQSENANSRKNVKKDALYILFLNNMLQHIAHIIIVKVPSNL